MDSPRKRFILKRYLFYKHGKYDSNIDRKDRKENLPFSSSAESNWMKLGLIQDSIETFVDSYFRGNNFMDFQ